MITHKHGVAIKVKIFIAVCMDLLDKFEKVVEEGKQGAESDYRAKLKTLIKKTLEFVETNEEFFNIWLKQARNMGKTFTKAYRPEKASVRRSIF